jgi:hypothetical protein
MAASAIAKKLVNRVPSGDARGIALEVPFPPPSPPPEGLLPASPPPGGGGWDEGSDAVPEGGGDPDE